MAESVAMNDPLPKSLRILCFGDSLTAGYTSYGWEFHPYADHLRVGLQHSLSTSDIEVDVAGLSGDQVRGNYLRRIEGKCASTETPYDWIIIMGGTNDLAWGQEPEIIYKGLSKSSLRLHPAPQQLCIWRDIEFGTLPRCRGTALFSTIDIVYCIVNWIITEEVWKVALDTGANVLGLNILEAEGSGDRENSERDSLNYKIVNHQQER